MAEAVQIKVGDSRQLLKTLPDQSIHCVVTSPPYWGLRDYGVPGQIGLENDIQGFWDAMYDVFKEVYRVLRDDGVCFINMGDTYKDQELLGIPWEMIRYLRQTILICPRCGSPKNDFISVDNQLKLACADCDFTALPKRFRRWKLRSEIIWHKPNPVPEPDRRRPTVAHETLFMLVKTNRYFYDTDAIRDPIGDEPTPDEYQKGLGSNNGADSLRWSAGYKKVSHSLKHPLGRNKRSVWTISTEGYKGAHFATFPTKLVEPCIKAGTSEMGCCAKCGRPWRRKTETQGNKERLGKSWHNHQDDLGKGQRGIPSAKDRPWRVTVGWEQACGCQSGDPVPCVVLDPFSGAGTTGLVARRLQRHYIGIELNPDYAYQSLERIANDMPLLNRSVLAAGESNALLQIPQP